MTDKGTRFEIVSETEMKHIQGKDQRICFPIHEFYKKRQNKSENASGEKKKRIYAVSFWKCENTGRW